MLQGYGDTVLRAETLEKELNKARKHSAMLQSKLDGAFAQYHNEVAAPEAQRYADVILSSTYCGYPVVV
jgi:hypothetical protein